MHLAIGIRLGIDGLVLEGLDEKIEAGGDQRAQDRAYPVDPMV
jgi:hypothetical protein